MEKLSNDFIEYVKHELGEDFVPLLTSRAICTKDDAYDFLHPSLDNITDPFCFSNVKAIVDRIKYAVAQGERIVIFGDYDCDGISAVYILGHYLKSIGADVNFFIPNREEDGYGLTDQTIETIAETWFPDLIITVDCGISGHDEIEYAKELGMDVIVTDHHELPDVLPDCLIFNTKLDAPDHYGMHCGAGTAFLLVLALGGKEVAQRYVDVAGVATIGDIVPLTGDNRIIVAEGLKRINSRSCNVGVKQFFERVGVTKVTSGDVAFRLVPGINAFGRLGDASRALELYTTEDRFVLTGVIDKMLLVNAERKQLCTDLEEHVIEKLEGTDFSKVFGICLADERWMAGVLGIAAAYVTERYMRPTILFTHKDGMLKGSGRSTDKVDLLDAIRACEEFTESYGGHKQAAGVTLKKENFEAFATKFNEYVASKYGKDAFVSSKKFDLEMPYGKVDYDYVRRLEMFEPCGHFNPRPRFHASVLSGKCAPFKSNPVNFRYSFGEQFAIPVFNQHGKEAIFASKSIKKDMLLEFKLNHFNGNVYVDANMSSCSFLPQGKDDELGARAIMTALSDNAVSSDVKRVDISDFAKELTGFGTLFVAYDHATVDALNDALGVVLPVSCGDLSSPNPIDCVVLYPIKPLDVSMYNTVVLLDLPALSAVGNTEFVFADLGHACLDLPKELVMRESLVNAFREISVKIKLGCTVEDVIGTDVRSARGFAYFVFRELGIIDEECGRARLTNVKSDLSKSALYNYVHNA